MTPEELLATLDQWASVAAEAMTAATEGASLCSVSRSGEQIPGVKYPEGRWAALREYSRALRRPGAELETTLVELREVWERDLSRRQESGQQNWVHYRLGGVDALAEVAELLAGE